MLRLLADQPGRPIGREELLRRVWGPAVPSRTRACDTTVSRLCAKIEADPSNPATLLTVHREGYLLVGEAPAGRASGGPTPRSAATSM